MERKKAPNRLRELREGRQLSVRDLAAKSGVDFNTVSRMERGTQPLDIPRMRKFARALEVKVSELLNDEDVELRADEEGRAVLAAVDSLPRKDRLLVIQATDAVVRVARALAAQRSAAGLSGNPQLADGLAGVWNRLDDDKRDRALRILRLSEASG